VVVTLMQTPRLKGEPLGSSLLIRLKVFCLNIKAGVLDLRFTDFLGFLINWLIVGIHSLLGIRK